MFVYKKLKPSDVSITPFEAHKQYTYDSSSAGNNGITFNTALWTSESKAHYSANNLAGNFQNHRNYFQFDKVFYRDYILDNANLIPDVNYIKQERKLYDKVNILSIPQGLFGNRIQPTTFNLTGSFNSGNTIIEINDDGEGNIYPSNYTLGTTNWPSEKRRVVYIGPVKGFKKKDLTVLNGTGNKIINGSDNFTLENVYDDSYYINQVDYNKVTFNGNTPLTFINTGVDGHLRLDHDTKYNFGFDEDFNISFYFKTSETDSQRVSGSADNGKYYFIAKSDIKTIVPSVNETLNTFDSGNLQLIDVPAENKYPFKLYYTDNVDETGSLFFERSNGSLTSFVSTSLFYSGSTDEIIHIAAQKLGNELQLWINGVKVVSGSDIDPVICKDQPPTNEANLYIGSRGNVDSYLNSNLSQIMIWNEALSSTQIQNISESITGTPYIGNIFYDEGFVTINHPSYSDVLQQYSGSISETITLNPTYGDEYNYDIAANVLGPNPTFDLEGSSINFYNESAKFWFDPENNDINDTTLRNGLSGGWYTFSPQLSTNLGNTNILAIKDEVLRLDFMTASNFDITDNTQQPFTPSGSNNSITSPTVSNSAPYAFLSTSRAETTESVNILFASNSQVLASETFPYTHTSISNTVFDFGDTTYINDGGEYVNNTDPAYGYLMVSGTNANSAYFRGQLKRLGGAGSQLVETTNTVEVDFNSVQDVDGGTRVVPEGLTDGANFDTVNNYIKILENPPFGALTFQIYGSITSITTSSYSNQGSTVDVYVKKNGSSVWHVVDTYPLGTDNSFNFSDWYNQSGGAEDGIQSLTAALNDEFSVAVRVNHNNLVSYRISNLGLKITGEAGGALSEGFKNKITLQHTKTSPKSNAIYSYNLQGIVTRPGAGGAYDTEFSSNNTTGLSQDINGNEVGVRVSLLQGADIITSSFYPSSSGTSEQDFSYNHFTGDNTNTLRLFIYPSIADSTDASYTGENQGFFIGSLNSGDTTFTLIEKSGSNELHLDTSLGVNFQNSDYEPIITFGNNSGSIYGSNPVSISSISSDIATVADEYLITGSIPATASYFVKQKISASTELEIVTSSLLTIENFYLGSGSDSFYSSSLTTNNGVPRVRIYSGSDLVNTSVGSVDETGYLIIENQHLGFFNSGSTLGIHLDVVDSASPSTAITSSEGEGYSIDSLQITGISSSITISRNPAFATLFNSEITHIQFSSPMSSIGDSNLPFSTGNITASVNYVNADTLTLDVSENLLFTTNSDSVKMIASSSEGFPINISWAYEGGGDGSIYEFFTGSNPGPYQLYDIIKTDGEIDDNEGLTLFIKDNDGNLLVTSSFINSASLVTTPLDLPLSFTSSISGTFLVELKTTNSESAEIPVTWDVALFGTLTNYSAWTKDQSKVSPLITELSASNTTTVLSSSLASNGVVGNENIFKIISGHSDTGNFSNSPYSVGTFNILGNIQEGVTSLFTDIVLDTPLFITASSEITGGYAQLQYFLTQESQSAVSLPSPLLEGNFTIGSNTYNIEFIDGTNFIIDEPLLLTENTNVTLNYHTTASNDFTVKFKNSHLIFEHEYQCSVDEEEYNYTQNISVKKNKSNKSSDLADCITGSIDNSQITLFKPYTTTVGLYDDNYNLLAVGKFAQPVRMSEETDMTFVIRWDS